jgi:hypothetical protein
MLLAERPVYVSDGSDSEYLAASITSPLVLKQPTYAMIPAKVGDGPLADSCIAAICAIRP